MPLTGVVALDGPSGTGKSSVARNLARRLGARYLDTGAMYRAVTWAVLRADVDLADADAVAAVARTVRIAVSTDADDQRIAVDGHHVEREIRSEVVTAAVSAVSAVPDVRVVLVARQRALIAEAADNGGIVVEGRDIGTVVAPDAALKVYLTATPEARAARRGLQNGLSGVEQLAAVLEAIRRRDAFDSGRAVSPLRPAPDAVEIDTTDLSLAQVVDRLVDLARERGLVVEEAR